MACNSNNVATVDSNCPHQTMCAHIGLEEELLRRVAADASLPK